MVRRGVWWKGLVCASTLTGCSSRTELNFYPGSEAGPTDGGRAGRGASEDSAGRGGGVGDGRAGSGGDAGRGGTLGNVGGGPASGGARPTPGFGGNATAGAGPWGGSGALGGSAGTGESCASVPACGGDVIGTWNVASSCLEMTGLLDVSPLALGCTSAPVSGVRNVAGTFTAKADGTYVDRTTTVGRDQIELEQECLTVTGTLVLCERIAPVLTNYGYDSVKCAGAADGGCRCEAAFERSVGLRGLSLAPVESGAFTTSGDVLTLDDPFNEPTRYQYCASAAQLALVPLPAPADTARGAVIFTKP